MKHRCYVCKPLTDEELKEWKKHSGFNAYRYGIDKFETVTPKKPKAADVMEYIDWEGAWASNGIPG